MTTGTNVHAEDRLADLHVILPSVDGVTALSAEIRARAEYLEAMGSYLESAAIARGHNAKAAEHEIRNAALWASTYFEMRATNRSWRAKENPSHLARVKQREEVLKERITQHFQDVLKGNITEELNWLLRESASKILVLRYGPRRQSPIDRDTSDKIVTEDLRHVRLTDAGRGSGGALVFLADGSQILPADWPFVLRGPEFDDARKNFEAARTAFLQEAQGSLPLDYVNRERLMTAVDRLCSNFNDVYPRERRLESGTTYAAYAAGKRFLQSLALQVFRAVNSNDRTVLSGRLQFQGDTVIDLVDYMCRNGLEFAPSEPGDERVYQRLFLALRAIYVTLAAEDPADDGGEKADTQKRGGATVAPDRSLRGQ